MFIEYGDRDGRAIKAMQVGHYVFYVCCRAHGEDDNKAAHVVVHMKSGRRLLCGLTQSGAAMLADTLSIYGEDCPTTFVEGPHIQLVMKWAGAVLRVGYEDRDNDLMFEPYTAWHERLYGVRPRPCNVPAIQSPSIPEGLLRGLS